MEIKRGSLYLADLNPRQGTEPGKLRPVVVIQSDFLNSIGHPSTWIIPCTTQLTSPNILRINLPKGCAGNDQECDVMVDQSRSIDNSRFKKLLGTIPTSFMNEIVEKLRQTGDL